VDKSNIYILSSSMWIIVGMLSV